jgi:small subunit ribosomal protein S3Ae
LAEKPATASRKKSQKGKTWYRILAPKSFNEVQLGESIAEEPETLVGRIVKANYSELARDITKQHLTCLLRIYEVKEGAAHTELIGYSLSKPFVQRVVRRRTSKIEEIIDTRLKDKNVRIKCTAITSFKTNTSKRTALRKAINAETRKAIVGFDLDNLIIALASGKLQHEINRKIRVIFPVRFFEIRKVELLKSKQIKEEKIEEVKKKESKREGKKIKIEPEEGEMPLPKEEPKEEIPLA